ncbi:hypothetical protein [Rhodoferax sp.]|uniref:hypothetical protein n=1 Tax=Rhodoferax sp. TaxID=50421 RepID=UPI0026349F3B|nr:hypothetical protein [Rhodoferax sp.]MDD2811119.1 hypothetical protein [Rhodoferax sp.]MDD4945045.1 hypothetical protein [Rhodoferax sp.]
MKYDFAGVHPRERGTLVHKWRNLLALSVKEMAEIIETTTRTVSAIESGAQPMSDVRWRFFVTRVETELFDTRPAELVVVTSAEQVPLDVVSRDNYAGFVPDDDGYWGVIASHCVNRQTGAPEVHRQRFLLRENPHVVNAALRWDALIEESDSSSASVMQRWLMRRILKGELNNPRLVDLKAIIRSANSELRAAGPDAPEPERIRLLGKLDRAIADLMEEVAKNTEGSGQ